MSKSHVKFLTNLDAFLGALGIRSSEVVSEKNLLVTSYIEDLEPLEEAAEEDMESELILDD